MGGQSGGSQTVTNKTEIDPVTQAWRTSIMNAGSGLYNQGAPAYYPNNTVVPFANQTMQGLNMLESQAQGGAPLYNAAINAAGNSFQQNPAMPLAMQTAQGQLPQNQYAQTLQAFGGANNPHLRSVFDQGAEQITNAVGGAMSRAGRYGSPGAHQGTLTRELGNLWNNINMPAYEQERNRGLSAAQTLGQMGEGALNRQVAGQELAGGMFSQGNMDAARMSALLPGLYDYGGAPARSLMGVGGAYEGLAQDYLDADRERYDYAANAPWAYLQQYAGLMSGLPDFSSTTTTGPAPRSNRALSALGGGMTGLGAAQALGMAGPAGWALGGLGALAGLFG